MNDKKLFTPGPLTTSNMVKQAMLRDLGSRDTEFINIIASIRADLLILAGVSGNLEYESVIMQGSGTFGIEAVISSVIPFNGHLLIIINGAYGERISKITDVYSINNTRLVFEENEWPSLSAIEDELISHPEITHVAVVHCETTTGILNPVESIGELVKKYGKSYIVDAMSSFGAVPLDMRAANIDFLISSSNKCIEGVPGFSFVIAKKESLVKSENIERTFSLNLFDQWKSMEQNGQFRFTPPVQVLLAFRKALDELKEEGGVEGRAIRYFLNYTTLIAEMEAIGFEEYVSRDKQGYIITSFRYPQHPSFDFDRFYSILSENGQIIYPGKLSKANCFRIGNIGRIYKNDIEYLTRCIRKALDEMKCILVPDLNETQKS